MSHQCRCKVNIDATLLNCNVPTGYDDSRSVSIRDLPHVELLTDGPLSWRTEKTSTQSTCACAHSAAKWRTTSVLACTAHIVVRKSSICIWYLWRSVGKQHLCRIRIYRDWSKLLVGKSIANANTCIFCYIMLLILLFIPHLFAWRWTQELEFWSEMHVKMAQIDYPIRRG